MAVIIRLDDSPRRCANAPLPHVIPWLTVASLYFQKKTTEEHPRTSRIVSFASSNFAWSQTPAEKEDIS